MATVKTPRLNLAKQAAGDNPGAWEVDMNQGYDDADARFYRTATGNPDGVETSDYIGQRYLDDATGLWYTATDAAAPGAWTSDLAVIDPLITHHAIPTTLPEDYPHGHLNAILDWVSITEVRLLPLGGNTIYVDISGGRETETSEIRWDISNPAHREAAQTEDPSIPYYLYIDNLSSPGNLLPIISKTAPQALAGTKPGYHPTLADHRNVGSVWQTPGSDIQKFTSKHGDVLFHSHSSDHIHALVGAASTAWRNEPVNVPLTASSVLISVSGASLGTGNGMIVVGPDGATGFLTGGQNDPGAAGFEDVLMHALMTGSDDASASSLHGDLPIVTPAVPAISYSTTFGYTALNMIVRGYHDIWAPRGY